MNRRLTWRRLIWTAVMALLAGCQSSTPLGAQEPTGSAPHVTAQALTALPKYLAIGGTYQITLAWTPGSPVVKLDGRALPVTGVAGTVVTFTVPAPLTIMTGGGSLPVAVAWGGPRTLAVTDGANQASRTSYVLGTAYDTTSKNRVLFLVSSGVTKATFDTWLLGTGLFTKPTQSFVPLGGPGACAGTLAEAFFDGAGTFEQALEQLDALAAANAGLLLGVNPRTTGSTGSELYDAAAVPMVGRTEINAAAAQARGYNGAGTLLAVLDTGVGSKGSVMAEFGTRLRPGQQFTAASQASPSLAGTSYDDYAVGGVLVGHGTQVATIAAGTNLGVAPAAGVLPVKVCDSSGRCRLSDVIRGVCWAAQQGVNAGVLNALVLNLSLGGDTGDFPYDILRLVLGSLTKKGVLIAASAGNDWDSYVYGPLVEPHHYPASYDIDGVLGVGALEKTSGGSFRTSLYSDRGSRIDVLAPGTLVEAFGPTGVKVSDNVGTSFAAPHVAGTLALWRQKMPSSDAGKVQSALLASANVNRVLKPDPQRELDAYSLLRMLDLTSAP